MSLIRQQKTCAVCAKPIDLQAQIKLDQLIDGLVRYVVVCPGESINVHRRNGAIPVTIPIEVEAI